MINNSIAKTYYYKLNRTFTKVVIVYFYKLKLYHIIETDTNDRNYDVIETETDDRNQTVENNNSIYGNTTLTSSRRGFSQARANFVSVT